MILDTEGIRAPEFAGQVHSDARDNKMATMSIIPSDASIMMTVGDDDSAVKDILPIVLRIKGSYELSDRFRLCHFRFETQPFSRAYESSSIAEESGVAVKPQMTILYKVNNATSQSFNSTLSERMALIESLSLVFK